MGGRFGSNFEADRGELLHPRAGSYSDLDQALWTVPSSRMKRQVVGKLNGAPHLVPLPSQAVAVLRDLQPLTGGGKLVFRGERHHDRPMSDNTINAALRAMGYAADEMTAHGFGRPRGRYCTSDSVSAPT